MLRYKQQKVFVGLIQAFVDISEEKKYNELGNLVQEGVYNTESLLNNWLLNNSAASGVVRLAVTQNQMIDVYSMELFQFDSQPRVHYNFNLLLARYNVST